MKKGVFLDLRWFEFENSHHHEIYCIAKCGLSKFSPYILHLSPYIIHGETHLTINFDVFNFYLFYYN